MMPRQCRYMAPPALHLSVHCSPFEMNLLQTLFVTITTMVRLTTSITSSTCIYFLQQLPASTTRSFMMPRVPTVKTTQNTSHTQGFTCRQHKTLHMTNMPYPKTTQDTSDRQHHEHTLKNLDMCSISHQTSDGVSHWTTGQQCLPSNQ